LCNHRELKCGGCRSLFAPRRPERFRRFGVLLPETESSRGAGQSRLRPCGVTPAWPLSCGAVSARNERPHVDLNPSGTSAGTSPTCPKGPCSNSEKTWWLNPANGKSTRERISFGSKRAGPKIEKPNFGTWLNKSCVMRTKARRHAPLIRCNTRERPTAMPAQCRTITGFKICGQPEFSNGKSKRFGRPAGYGRQAWRSGRHAEA